VLGAANVSGVGVTARARHLAQCAVDHIAWCVSILVVVSGVRSATLVSARAVVARSDGAVCRLRCISLWFRFSQELAFLVLLSLLVLFESLF
jgi:hypothetical protein